MLQKFSVVLMILYMTNSLFQFNQLQHSKQDSNHQDFVVEVQLNALKMVTPSLKKRNYLLISASNGNRRRSYQLFKSKFSKTIQVLKNFNFITNQSLLIKSQIKQRYIPRTQVYEFSQGILYNAKIWYSIMALNILKTFGVEILKDENLKSYLNEKQIFYTTIGKAVGKLQNSLMKMNEKFSIQQISGIEFQGISNKLQIQNDILNHYINNRDSYYFQQNKTDTKQLYRTVETGKIIKAKVSIRLQKDQKDIEQLNIVQRIENETIGIIGNSCFKISYQ